MIVKRVPILSYWATGLCLIGLLCLLPLDAQAQSEASVRVQTATPRVLDLIRGKSVMLNSQQAHQARVDRRPRGCRHPRDFA